MPAVVALHAHPDDESSKGAGTVARLVESGYRAVLVCATGGEAGDILNPALDSPDIKDRLAEVRSAELSRAAAIIGYDEVIMLGYRDSGMPDSPDNRRPDAFVNADTATALGRVVSIIRRERPEIVMGYDSHERYPHPDHLKVHELTMRVVEACASASDFPEAGDPWRIPVIVAPTFTRRKTLALHEEMLRRGKDSPLGPRLAGSEGEEDLPDVLVRVDVTGHVERGRDALRAHATQVDPDGYWFQIPTELVEAVYPFEDFEVIHAEDGALEAAGIFDAWGDDRTV